MPTSSGHFSRWLYMKNNKLYAVILLAVFVGPALILGFFVAPWFFLLMLGVVLIPLLFINRGLEKGDKAR